MHISYAPEQAAPGFRCAVALLCLLLFRSALRLPLARISSDNLTNTDSDHKTEVEPHSFAWGSTIAGVVLMARRPGINRVGQRRRWLLYLDRRRKDMALWRLARD